MLHRFLIIDDSDLDCYIVQKKIEHLAKDNIEVFQYKEGSLALEAIREIGSTPEKDALNIILLDILMPVMDGYRFMEQFENLDEEVKKNFFIVAITSSMYKNQINKIYAYKNIKGVIEKPFSIHELNEIIKKADPNYAFE